MKEEGKITTKMWTRGQGHEAPGTPGQHYRTHNHGRDTTKITTTRMATSHRNQNHKKKNHN